MSELVVRAKDCFKPKTTHYILYEFLALFNPQSLVVVLV